MISVLKQKYKPLNFKERSCIEVYERFHQGACPIETVERILKNFSTQIEKDWECSSYKGFRRDLSLQSWSYSVHINIWPSKKTAFVNDICNFD